MDESSGMGESLRQRKGPFEGDGACISRPQVGSAPLALLRRISLLASALLFLASHGIRTVSQLQGISVARGVWNLLRCAFREEHPVGDGVPVWSHKRPTVRREYNVALGMPSLRTFPVHLPMVSRLWFHDARGGRRGSEQSGQTAFLTVERLLFPAKTHPERVIPVAPC